MTKWLCTIFFLLITIPAFDIAMYDQGASISDWLQYPIWVLTIVLGVLTFIVWLKEFSKNKNRFAITGCLLSIVLILSITYCYLHTHQKINRAYFLLATNPDERRHQYHYYFRTDSTLKTHGSFTWNDANEFQQFRMRGDTIFLDTILDGTGIQSRIYLKTSTRNTKGHLVQQLVPLDKNGSIMDSLTKFKIEVK